MSAISTYVVLLSWSPPLARKATATSAIATGTAISAVRASGESPSARARACAVRRGALALATRDDTLQQGAGTLTGGEAPAQERPGGCGHREAEQDQHDEQGAGQAVVDGAGGHPGGPGGDRRPADVDRLGGVARLGGVERLELRGRGRRGRG